MCAAHGKLLINAALGFDTYLVMRHGETSTAVSAAAATSTDIEQHTEHAEHSKGEHAEPRWGCYFCNDIVAATNSQRDRSLDQQCTVTRPGLSFIAAALCVELLVALMHRRSHDGSGNSGSTGGVGGNSGSDGDGEAVDEDEGICGAATRAPIIPHQIRGSVAGFTQFTPHVQAMFMVQMCI